ncbi:hypothetical protein HY489_04400 [Candidatus Woesearchaeota archaeon]|nr:hypothetical protein [Candidatus Woesearchaeota archaeon]
MTNKETKIFSTIAVLAIIGILLFIFVGLKKPPPEAPTVEYNYYIFTQIEGLWETTVKERGQEYTATFRFNPTEVENLPVNGNKTGFRKPPIYLTFDPDASKDQFKYLALATTELSLHLIRGLNQSVEAACTKNETQACADRPIINCKSNASVIYLLPKAPAQITLDNCITLSGEGIDLLKSVDRLLYQLYGIMR